MLTRALILVACAAGAFAQITTSASNAGETATATVLVGSITSGLAGSVVTAQPCGDTTYALTCTDADACSGLDLTFTVTEGPTDFRLQYSTTTEGAEAVLSESCSLSGSSYAVCTIWETVSADGKKKHTKTKTTYSGTALPYAQVPITAGGNMLSSATASCTASGNAAAATGVSEIYKVLVVPAAAAAMAVGAFA